MYILEVPHGVLYPEAHINRFKKKTGGDQPTTLERPRVFGRKPRTEGELGRERENMGRKGAWMKKSKARDKENRKGARRIRAPRSGCACFRDYGTCRLYSVGWKGTKNGCQPPNAGLFWFNSLSHKVTGCPTTS